jgi:hypothetical protein
MRYLSPAYLPMLVIGVYALKTCGPRRVTGSGEASRTLFWLAVIDLPLIFIILQVIAGRNLAGQVTFVTTLTYIFLAGSCGALCRRPRPPRLPPPPRLRRPGADAASRSPGTAVVDFRFATSCWEGYHFWIPVVEYIWYIQYTIFPF